MANLTIKITTEIPIEKSHGLTVGSIWPVEKVADSSRAGYWVMAKSGERVKVLPHECEVIARTEGKEAR